MKVPHKNYPLSKISLIPLTITSQFMHGMPSEKLDKCVSIRLSELRRGRKCIIPHGGQKRVKVPLNEL